jgi:serine/threonine-protein kinase
MPALQIMDSQRWQKIDQLFHSALERQAAERAAFLTQACTGDESLQREVESLIGSHQKSDSFIEAPAADIAAELLSGRETRLTAGQAVGPYKIVSRLGEGGMGEVYLAQDSRLGRQVALKRLPALFTLDPDRVLRFEQEARAISALNHPNIVTIHEIGKSNSLHFLATEFINGQTLRQHMFSARMKLDEVLDIAGQIAAALAAAHAAGIVHRDIKPENIMLRQDRIVKVLDFGLAKLASRDMAVESHLGTSATVKTNPGLVMGTVQYMSPEQARGKDVDARTDIWSLGVVLYEMTTGRVPFEGETTSHVLVSLMESKPIPIKRYSQVPVQLERIVSKALRKNRDERYQTAGDLAFDLRGLKQELEVDARLKQSFERETYGAAEEFEESDQSTVQIRAHPTSGTEYLVSEIKRYKRVLIPVLAAVTVFTVLTALAYFAYSRYAGGSRATPIRSLAVLPFTNATDNPDTEYLSDGISESLINSLSQLPGMKVSARNSSFKYKGKNDDLQAVAKALGVDAIMTGQVTQRGDSLLINVELVDARDRTHIWGDQYNRKEVDLLALQSEISSKIARNLRLRLTAGEQQQLAKRETVNLQAYELLLKGRFTWRQGGTANRKAALEYYRQATVVDPAYALAYAEMSNSYDSLITNNELDPKEFRPKADAAASKALELDENLADAHLAVAWSKISAWDWAAAEREVKRTLELNPNLVGAHNTYAVLLRVHGRREEAVEELNRARELDPLSPAANRNVVTALGIFRQNDQALEAAKKLLDLDRSNPNSQIRVGQFYVRVGRYREGIAAYQEAIKLGDDSPDVQTLLASAYAMAGEREKARAILKRLETGPEYVSPVAFATIHFALGEREKGFAALEAAYIAHDQQLIWLRGAWEFDHLHSDPRFQDLARRIGLM